MNIRMSVGEASLFLCFLKQASSYFEFGMGGSTEAALQIVSKHVVAVDSDDAWIERIRPLPTNGCQRELIYCDIGPTKEWGYPISREKKDCFSLYSRSIKSFKHIDFDLCLVDGRFRVACFFQALQTMRPNAVIGIHDYRSRPQYHIVENYSRVIAETEDMSLFIRKSNINDCEIEKEALRYETNPA